MKLVLLISNHDYDSYFHESFIVFEDVSVVDANNRLSDTQEKNSFIDSEYWKNVTKFQEELEKYVISKGYDKDVALLPLPKIKYEKFCGLEVMPRRDGDTEYKIITLDEWIEQHSYNENLE